MRLSTVQLQRQQVDSLQQGQLSVSRLQQQISTGNKLISSYDDPVASAQIRALNSNLTDLKQYNSNGNAATQHLSLEETTVTNINTALQKINELRTQALNGTVNSGQRKIIAAQMESQLQTLMGFANTQDANGNYLFSGLQNHQQPFVQSNGQIVYQGDQGQRFLPISAGRNIAISDSGFALFENIQNGNGMLVATANSNNTGTGLITAPQLANNGLYVPDQYTIRMVTNSSGQLAYEVTGANTGQVIPALPATSPAQAAQYLTGNSINFNGVQVQITGMPAAGDTFSITPSQPQSMFTTIQNMINVLNTAGDTAKDNAGVQNILNSQGDALSQAMTNAMVILTNIGDREQAVSTQQTTNQDVILQYQVALSQVAETDLTSAITSLNSQMLALQAAQQLYGQTKNLTLFNYLGT